MSSTLLPAANVRVASISPLGPTFRFLETLGVCSPLFPWATGSFTCLLFSVYKFISQSDLHIKSNLVLKKEKREEEKCLVWLRSGVCSPSRTRCRIPLQAPVWGVLGVDKEVRRREKFYQTKQGGVCRLCLSLRSPFACCWWIDLHLADCDEDGIYCL